MSKKYVLVRIRKGLVHGLLGKYYEISPDKPPEKQFLKRNLRKTRIDPQINFVWWDKPAPEVPAEFFAVEWAGNLVVNQAGLYRFYILTDDGARLWINDKLIIDAWKDQAPTVYHSDVLALSAGYHKIDLRFYNKYVFGEIMLGWIRPDGIAEIIPSENYATPLNDKILIKGLPSKYRIELWSGGKLLEAEAKDGKAELDVKEIMKPIDGYFKIYDDTGRLIFESPVIRDIWGGDIFQIGEE